jgi:hypothetical protein
MGFGGLFEKRLKTAAIAKLPARKYLRVDTYTSRLFTLE